MRYDDLYLAGTGVWLPDLMPVGKAVADGLLDPRRAEEREFVSVAVAGEEHAPPWMAAQAARTALDRAGTAPEDVALLLHCSNWWQGLDVWAAASYVAQESGLRQAPAFEVIQRCNAGLGALELAASRLTAATDSRTAAVVTTGDRMSAPRIDRWNTLGISFYGDAGTAVVVSRTSGFARLVASYTVADNSLEALGRGTEELTPQPPAPGPWVDLEDRARSRVSLDLPDAGRRLATALNDALDGILAESGLTMSDIARVVIPHTRQGSGRHELHDLLGVPEESTTWAFGAAVGHLTSGDQFAGLDHLLRTRAVAPGDHVLIWGGGAGYTCTAFVIEILDLPAWTA
ncbi:ketoacyl-ACP synthase III family protein [Kitasatospora sp. NPDC101235]|uniref:ketoacyl-ACP synthase III family protein n=1 Tax=Kitasatospora sp. NPDC101235 TaxID=3364101 RepID=UPI00381FC2F0